MNSLKLIELKQEFQHETNVPLYTAMQKYFGQYDTKYFCYDNSSATELDEEGLLATIEHLKELCLQDNNSKINLICKHKSEFFRITEEKCLHPEKTRYSSMYTAIMPFLDEDLIKKTLCENPLTCWNPYRLANYNSGDAVLIFQPSVRLIKEYPFIKKKYSGTTRIVLYYYVDIDELKNYRRGDIVIEPSDILELNRRYLHPYVRGVIQRGPYYTSLKNGPVETLYHPRYDWGE